MAVRRTVSAPIQPLLPIVPDGGARIDLEQVRQILPQIVDSLVDAVVVVNRNLQVVAANRRYLEAFGSGRAQLVGVPCTVCLACPEHAANGGGEPCGTCDAIELKQPQRRLRSMRDASGGQRRWEGTFTPVTDRAGEVSHVVEVWRDISDRTQLEAQLSHNERLASLGILAAGVAHEINNPLASMLAGIESLERSLKRAKLDPAQSAEAAEVLAVLERETIRCRETTDKLMLLAQPHSVAPAWVDLNCAVRDTLALLRHQLNKQRVRAETALEETLPPLWGKETAVRSVCMNLLMNALQAMPEGGTLLVRTERAGAGLALHVLDDGPGVPLELEDRIWDPFFTTKPIGQGTGLGLSITQRIVHRHGGSIRLERRAAGGAHFVVELPLEGPGGLGG
ncbi:MAG: hypothetical protein A2W00_07675 [Candidatus Eisenbacteria bacterium RBG_16_71_46]|nr:MAG: hypothetical protein A2W00_07675 [Candidatus Eisenbacteria bacterium RBG_16_71_46]OGF24746.1 MAG: hypothetical protein A2V63_04750 [Candidatus Eisenbacteria bacterium RBG_19FT_COMBO_70_11]